MNILVTGANGQLGNEMRRVSTGSADRYLFTDVAELDITDSEAVERTVRREDIGVIVNCAAYTNVDRAEQDRATADLLNRQAVENLARAARMCDAVLIHISTDYVFGGTPQNTPFDEQAQGTPIGVYGQTKLEGERAILQSGCRHLIFRTAWLYSPFGNNFVKTMRRLTAERDSLEVVFDQVGTPTCAADLAALLFKVIEERMLDRQGIYHFSNEGVCSWYDFAVEIARLSRNRCDIRPCHSDEFPSKVTRPAFSVLDKTKVKRTFGIRIPHWTRSLERCIAQIEAAERNAQTHSEN